MNQDDHEGMFRGMGSESFEDADTTWELSDERSHTACFEGLSFGRRINDDGVEMGIRLAFHEHIGLVGVLSADGPTDMQVLAESLWIHLTPNHAYDLLIALLRGLSDADAEDQIDWSLYRWPMKPDQIVLAMRDLAFMLYPDFDPNPPQEGPPNDPANS